MRNHCIQQLLIPIALSALGISRRCCSSRSGRLLLSRSLLGLVSLLAKDLVQASSLVCAAVLFRLQISKSSRLGVDILHLSGTLEVELGNLLAGGGVAGLLKVAAQAAKEVAGALGDAISLVGSSGAVSGLVLLVQILNLGKER
jgi:hypothetical protein